MSCSHSVFYPGSEVVTREKREGTQATKETKRKEQRTSLSKMLTMTSYPREEKISNSDKKLSVRKRDDDHEFVAGQAFDPVTRDEMRVMSTVRLQ